MSQICVLTHSPHLAQPTTKHTDKAIRPINHNTQINIHDTVTPDVLKYCVHLSDKALGPLLQNEQSDNSKQVFHGVNRAAILDEMQNESMRKYDMLDALLLGELHKQYIQHAWRNIGDSNSKQVVIVDDGTHECTHSKCEMIMIHGKVYSLSKQRVHVCLQAKGYTCPAPASCHIGTPYDLSGKLFSCRSSGKAHICTPDLCNEPRDSIDGFMHCRLTGKVLGSAKLSYGWIEDSWRPVISKKQKQKPSPALQESTDSGSCMHANHHSNRLILQKLMKTPPNGDHKALQLYIDLFKRGVKKSFKVIRSLMSGSPERTVLDQKALLRVKTKIVNGWQRHVKTCTQSRTRIDTCELQQIVHRELDAVTMCPVPINKYRMDHLCSKYAAHISAYIVQLLTRTNLGKAEINWTDCVVALLYLQCNRFRLQNTVIIDVDPFLLQCLPPACNLSHFSLLKRNNFTHTKTTIQAAIIEASHTGISLSLLQMPPLQISDLV